MIASSPGSSARRGRRNQRTSIGWLFFYTILPLLRLLRIIPLLRRENPDQKVSILIAAMGLVLSLFWLCVAVGTVVWIGQWRSQAENVSLALDRRFDSYSQAEEPHKQPLHKRLFQSPEGVTACLPAVFAVAWLIVLLFTLM